MMFLRIGLALFVLSSCASVPSDLLQYERPTSADLAVLAEVVSKCGLPEGAFSFVDRPRSFMVVIRADPRLVATQEAESCVWRRLPGEFMMRFGAEQEYEVAE
jgi:hypothetical protein